MLRTVTVAQIIEELRRVPQDTALPLGACVPLTVTDPDHRMVGVRVLVWAAVAPTVTLDHSRDVVQCRPN